MGALYHLKQKLVDFCNVIQENVSRTDTVPSSKVVYDLKADSDTEIGKLKANLLWTNPSPTSSFSEQVIAITNPYLYTVVTFKGHASYADKDQFAFIGQTNSGWNQAIWAELEGAKKIWVRPMQIGASSVSFKNCTYALFPNGTLGQENERLIPYHIYGTNSIV